VTVSAEVIEVFKLISYRSVGPLIPGNTHARAQQPA
jgi:hypothetical protein